MKPATVGLLWSLALLTIVSATSDRYYLGILCGESMFLMGVKEVCGVPRKRNLHNVHYEEVSGREGVLDLQQENLDSAEETWNARSSQAKRDARVAKRGQRSKEWEKWAYICCVADCLKEYLKVLCTELK